MGGTDNCCDGLRAQQREAQALCPEPQCKDTTKRMEAASTQKTKKEASHCPARHARDNRGDRDHQNVWQEVSTICTTTIATRGGGLSISYQQRSELCGKSVHFRGGRACHVLRAHNVCP